MIPSGKHRVPVTPSLASAPEPSSNRHSQTGAIPILGWGRLPVTGCALGEWRGACRETPRTPSAVNCSTCVVWFRGSFQAVTSPVPWRSVRTTFPSGCTSNNSSTKRVGPTFECGFPAPNSGKYRHEITTRSGVFSINATWEKELTWSGRWLGPSPCRGTSSSNDHLPLLVSQYGSSSFRAKTLTGLRLDPVLQSNPRNPPSGNPGQNHRWTGGRYNRPENRPRRPQVQPTG